MSVSLLDPGRPERIATDLADLFAEVHGRPADAVHVAPGRVNLIGEHVDYNGGRCLPYALPHGTYVASAARVDGTVTVRSQQMPAPWTARLDALGKRTTPGWVNYVAGVIWALREAGVDVPGLDLVIDSRVPVGAGLSSSAALECAVALAAVHAAGVRLDDTVRALVVAACIRAENEVAGASTGGLDQSVAVYADAGHALLLDFAAGSRRQVRWDPGAIGLELLVVDTRVRHALNDGGYDSRRQDCEKAAELLGVDHLADVTDLSTTLASLSDERLRRRTRHVVTEVARVDAAVRALDGGDVASLGALFLASHASLRDDFEVSCDELDVVVTTAMEQGALGARMTGGGFGGSAIALVPRTRLGDVEAALTGAFAERARGAPILLSGAPGSGARRLL